MTSPLEQLIENLIAKEVLFTPRVIRAFKAVDRIDFVLPQYEHLTYEDIALPIGHGQTISQPYTVAFMLEALAPKPGEKILDVGTGSGWTTALLAHIVGRKGRVYGTEIIPALAEFGQDNLNKYSFPNASIQEAMELGLKSQAPFDRILVSASGTKLPEELLEQLKVGGTMVIPINEEIWKVEKTSNTEIEIEKFPGFLFVPLINSR